MKKPFLSTGLGLVGASMVAAILLGGIPFPALAARQSRIAFDASGPVEIVGIPTPDQMLTIYEDTPFTVPPDSYFVVTGVGRSKTSPSAYRVDVLFDGQAMLKTSFSYDAYGAAGMLADVPPGLVAPAGVVVEALSSFNAGGVIFGYVAPVR